MKSHRETFPARLADGSDATAELLRKVEKQPPHAPPEAAAWERTLTRLGREPGHPRLRLALAATAGALAGAVVLFAVLSRHAPEAASSVAASPPIAASAPIAPLVPAPAPVVPSLSSEATEVPRIQLGRAPVGLPAGRSELVNEAAVALSRGGSARAFTTAAAATVELDAGEVELHVEKRPAAADHAFEVTAGGYRFTVLGTVFRVSRANDDVTLSVSEGRVAVARLGAPRSDAPLTIVTGGGFWSGSDARGAPRARGSSARVVPTAAEGTPALLALTGAAAPRASGAARPSAPSLEPAPFESPAPVKVLSPAPAAAAPATSPARIATAPAARPPRPAVLPTRCARRADATARATIDCLLNEARGSDLGAQVALYEVARLYRDEIHDVGRAITTLRELRRRFPDGALAVEAALSLAELLPQVGKYREALEASGAALASNPSRQRVDELHLLRGDLLRAGLNDCAGAATEYAAADGARESVADPAAFGRAVCLQTLGRVPEAREAFQRYLARPHARHADEAARRVRALTP
ncbi:MAG TPA: FecR domain-containing protein [Polyangia bacterium]|nr:FecR domain-containing protein [Polyangia bacterium]